jgi:hypothetical protein
VPVVVSRIAVKTWRGNVLRLQVVDNLRVVVFRQLSCQDVASCPVVAAQECREQRPESGWVISRVRRRERCRCRPVVHRCLEGWGSLVVVDDVEVDSGNTATSAGAGRAPQVKEESILTL